MSLATLITRATATAFRSVGDLALQATWRQPGLGAYDVTTGRQAATPVSTTVDVIVGKLSQAEISAMGVSRRSMRLIIQGSDLSAITPVLNDHVIVSASLYTVKDLSWCATTDVWTAVVEYVKRLDFSTTDFSPDFS